MHGQSMMSVYRQIDMSLLPDEYLPDDYDGPSAGSLEDITGKLVLSLRCVNCHTYAIYCSCSWL